MTKKGKLNTTKNRILNTIMIDGKKKTAEKILLKSFKNLQKKSSKKTSNILSFAVKNSTPSFKMNHQKLKKKKRKTLQEIPTFIRNDFFRINLSLKLIVLNSKKKINSSSFFEKLTEELLNSTNFKSSSVAQKVELQKQILLKKNLFFKYRWKK